VLARTGLVSVNAAHPSISLSEGGVGQSRSYGYYAGLLDEVSIHNRALSASEVQAIYNGGSAGKCHIPIITDQPQSQVGYWGKSVSFTMTVAGTDSLSYQWLKDSVLIVGATESSFVLTNLQMTIAGAYSMVITSASGSVTSNPVILTMNPAGVSLPFTRASRLMA
jgi:hypothetical protein